MSELRSLVPVTDRDYTRVRDHIVARRKEWEGYLVSGLDELTGHLRAAGYVPVTSEQRLAALVRRDGALSVGEVLASGRLKETEAIIAKMRRFGEPLRVMLDVWGYRNAMEKSMIIMSG